MQKKKRKILQLIKQKIKNKNPSKYLEEKTQKDTQNMWIYTKEGKTNIFSSITLSRERDIIRDKDRSFWKFLECNNQTTPRT